MGSGIIRGSVDGRGNAMIRDGNSTFNSTGNNVLINNIKRAQAKDRSYGNVRPGGLPSLRSYGQSGGGNSSNIYYSQADIDRYNQDLAAYEKKIEDKKRAEQAKKAQEAEQKRQGSLENVGKTTDTNAGCPTGKCEQPELQCLTEVMLDVKAKDASNTYYWKSRKENRKAIPKTIFVTGKEAKINYQISGGCNYGRKDACTLGTLIINGNTQSADTVKSLGQKGEINCAYDSKLKVAGTITKTGFSAHRGRSDDSGTGVFWNAFRFFFLSELKDFPVNVRNFLVAECDKNKIINESRVKVVIVSAPKFEVELDCGIVLDREVMSAGTKGRIGKNFPTVHPDSWRISRYKIENEFTVKYNDVKVSCDIPLLEVASTPIFNTLTVFINTLARTRKMGSLPIAFTIKPPELHVKAKAALVGSSSNNPIERSGTIGFDPLIGLELKIDIYEILTLIGGAIGKAVRKGVKNKFKEVAHTSDGDTEARKKALGTVKSTGVAVTAFIYFSGGIDFKGDVSVVPTELFEGKLPFKDPKLGAEIKLGLYAGIRAEARLFGVGGSLTGGFSISTSWEGYYYFGKGGVKIWHNGIYIKVYLEGEVGSTDAKNRGGQFGYDHDGGKGKVDWSGKVYDGGSESSPWINTTT